MIIQVVLAALAAAALIAWLAIDRGRRRRLAESRRARRVGASLLAVACLAAGLNYFVQSRAKGFLHDWDLFHSIQTVRHFDSYGYFGLYECLLVFDAAGPDHLAEAKKIRRLKTLHYIERKTVLEQSNCEELFSPEERASFMRDYSFWYKRKPWPRRWRRLLKDKGFNGTPYYGALVKLFYGWGELSNARLYAGALLDIILLLVAFGFVWRAFGAATAGFAFIFFCTFFPARFVHMGGSFLRFDYLALSIIGLSLLRMGRGGWAGAAVALATASRIFPLLIAAAVIGRAVVRYIDKREIDPIDRDFAIGFAAVLLAAFLFSLYLGGVGAWRDFIHNMEIHTRRTAGYRIGYRHMFMLIGRLDSRHGFIGYDEKARHFESVKLYYYLTAAGFMVFLALLARQLDRVSFAAIAALTVFYLAFAATRYYYAFFALAFVAGYQRPHSPLRASMWLGLFLISILAYLAHWDAEWWPWVYNTVLSALIGIGTLSLLIAARVAPDGLSRLEPAEAQPPEP